MFAYVPSRLPSCSSQPALPAAALCSVCRQPFAGRFLTVRPDGRAICHACADRESLPLQRAERNESRDPVLAMGWRRTLLAVLAEPRTLAVEYRGPIGPAVRMGLLWTFMGHLVKTSWVLTLQGEYVMDELRKNVPDDFPPDLIGWVPWLALPIALLFRITFGFGLFHLGLRLAGASADQWRSHLRAWSLASVTLLFCLVPMFGPLLSVMAWISVIIGYARQSYGLSTWRAALALFPSVVVIWVLDLGLV